MKWLTLILTVVVSFGADGAPVDIAARLRAHMPAKRLERAESPKQRETRLEREKQGRPRVEIAKPLPLVVQPGLILTNISVSAGNVTLGWQGQGTNLVQVQGTATLQQSWTDLGQPSAASQATFPTSGSKSFYRLKVANAASGQLKWLRSTLSHVGGAQVATAVKCDALGNAFVVGRFSGTVDFGGGPVSSGNLTFLYRTIFIAKYTADNSLTWVKTFGGVVGDAEADSVTVDSQNNVILIGWFSGTINFGGGPLVAVGYSPFAVKYDANGGHLWSKAFTGGVDINQTMGVTVDGSDNVLLTLTAVGSMNFGGIITTAKGIQDVAVVKLAPSGNTLWAKQWGGTFQQYAHGISTTASGDPVITGYFTGGSTDLGGGTTNASGNSDIFFARYSGTDGSYKWSKVAGTNGWNMGYAVTVDQRTGNMIFTGHFDGHVNLGGGLITTLGAGGIFLVGYDASGNWLWNNAYGNGGNSAGQGDTGKALCLDSNSNLFLTGTASFVDWQGTGSFSPVHGFFVTKFNLTPAANYVWAFNSSGSGSSDGNGITIDALGHVVAGGDLVGTINFGGESASSSGSLNPSAFVAQYNQ